MLDFAAARRMMVDSQVRTSDVTNLQLIAAMLAVPRERFVPKAAAELAYLDTDLPVGTGPPEGRAFGVKLEGTGGSVVDGVPMPTEAPITRDASAPDGIARDDDGNALGGIRGPWITVPDVRYIPHCQAHPNEGAIEPFTAKQRAAKGLNAGAFVERIGARAGELVAERFLVPEDVDVYTDHAEAVAATW